jgi:hypothetical protein
VCSSDLVKGDSYHRMKKQTEPLISTGPNTK